MLVERETNHRTDTTPMTTPVIDSKLAELLCALTSPSPSRCSGIRLRRVNARSRCTTTIGQRSSARSARTTQAYATEATVFLTLSRSHALTLSRSHDLILSVVTPSDRRAPPHSTPSPPVDLGADSASRPWRGAAAPWRALAPPPRRTAPLTLAEGAARPL
jgi:hypothetical protein